MEIQADFIRETDSAILIVGSDGEDVWLPKSQLKDLYVDYTNETVLFDIPQWLAEEKGMD